MDVGPHQVCVTPPLINSPINVFPEISIAELPWRSHQSEVPHESAVNSSHVDSTHDLDSMPWKESPNTIDNDTAIEKLSRGVVVEEDQIAENLSIDEQLQDDDSLNVAIASAESTLPKSVTISFRLFKFWLASAGVMLLLTIFRVRVTLRRVTCNAVETPEELQALVQHLSHKFKLGRRVRLLVTSAKVGPAVVGLLRPLIILPEVVTRGRSMKELEPIVAHELLHIKRGDLGIGWLQVLVQSLWWFHPLVWLVNRLLSREAERCCDEAVIAELDCTPSFYARCLLNVLEQKRNLTPVPACPGVKPVEITKQRMERIMKLGQGCRKRSPWWCWLIVVLLGVVVLPGRGESETDEIRATVIFQLDDAHTTKVTTEIEKEGWNASATDSQTLATRRYSIENVVQRMQNDYDLTEQAAQMQLELLVSSSIPLLEDGPQIQGSPAALTKCIVSANTLIVRGSQQGHELVTRLLKLWETVGLYQIKVTTRFASTNVEVTAENVTGKQDATSALTAKLTELDAFRLINTMQGDVRTNIYFAPKVTLFNGQQAVVRDEVLRPFVTGMDGNDPVIDVLPDGWKLKINSTVNAEGNIELKYELRLSAILDVDIKELQGSKEKEPATVQVPDARQLHVRSMATLRDGETLLVSGLKQEAEENFLMMITAKLEKVDLVNRDAQTDPDRPIYGVGINSDSGVVGKIVYDERNDAVQSVQVPIVRHPRLRQMSAEISVSFEEEPLKQVIEQICEAGNLKVMFYENDKDEIEEFFTAGLPDIVCFENELVKDGISLTNPVTFSAENAAAIQVLEDILKPYQLWLDLRLVKVNQRGEHKGVMVIRSQNFVDQQMVKEYYPIGDLLQKDQSLKEGSIKGVPILNKIPHQEKLFKAIPKTKGEVADTLIEILEKALAWGYAGKTYGTIEYDERNEALVIICNRSQHDLISKLLSERRNACGIKIKSVLSDQQPYLSTNINPKDGPGAGGMPLLKPTEANNVQLRILGPEQSRLTIHVPDHLKTIHQLVLPGRINLEPGRDYQLKLDNIPGRQVKSNWPVPYSFDPDFHWTLEIPESSKVAQDHLAHNSIPLKFTQEDFDQVASNQFVVKVVYLPDAEFHNKVIRNVETIVSTRLDPGVDPIAEADRRGTIIAILRSQTKQSWNKNVAKRKDLRSKDEGLMVARVYQVADLVVPIPGIENPPAGNPPSAAWGKPIRGTPNSIPGPPHRPLDSPQKPATYPSPKEGDLALSGQHSAKSPPSRLTPVPNCDASPLIELITQTVKNAHAQILPEEFNVEFMTEQLSLVVLARARDHEIISELLTTLRRKQGIQVTLECLTVQFEQNSFQQFWANGGVKVDSREPLDTNVQNSITPLIFHNVDKIDFKKQVKSFGNASILSAPKLTVFNGVGAQINISGTAADNKPIESLDYMIVPTISTDGDSIDLKLAINATSLLDALSKSKALNIRDGHSVLVEITDELPPLLKLTGVPEVDKALRELKKKEQGVRTMLMLTPRGIIQEEEEELLEVPN